jgi:hypothetical protein
MSTVPDANCLIVTRDATAHLTMARTEAALPLPFVDHMFEDRMHVY